MFRAKPSMRAFVVQLLVDFFLYRCAHKKETGDGDVEIASDPTNRTDRFSRKACCSYAQTVPTALVVFSASPGVSNLNVRGNSASLRR
jgi:hypothetical protein